MREITHSSGWHSLYKADLVADGSETLADSGSPKAEIDSHSVHEANNTVRWKTS